MIKISHSSKLTDHMITHTGEEAISNQCNKCNKALTKTGLQNGHLSTHTGEKYQYKQYGKAL